MPKVDPNKQNHRKDQKDKLCAQRPFRLSADLPPGPMRAGSPLISVFLLGRFEVDMERWGLLAAANTLGLSSPSMGLFLKSVKQQVAQEQLALKMKREAEKVLVATGFGSRPFTQIQIRHGQQASTASYSPAGAKMARLLMPCGRMWGGNLGRLV